MRSHSFFPSRAFSARIYVYIFQRRPPVPRAQRNAKKNTHTAAPAHSALPPEKKVTQKQSSAIGSRACRVSSDYKGKNEIENEVEEEKEDEKEGVSRLEKKKKTFNKIGGSSQSRHADEMRPINTNRLPPAPPLATSISLRKQQREQTQDEEEEEEKEEEKAQQHLTSPQDLVTNGPTSMSLLFDQSKWQSAPPLSPTWLAEEEARRSAPGDAIFDGERGDEGGRK